MTTLQNLFVAKLPRNLTDTDLQKIFDEYEPVSAKIMLDANTGKSKGFGFVLFDSEEAGRVAYEKLNKTHVTLQGHSFNLCIFPSKHDGRIANEPSSALYVRNIPKSLSQAEVEEFLRQFGALKYCAMREDHYGGNVWVVYTEYETVESAKDALEQLHGNKSHFPDQVILAKFADSEEAKRERRRRREQSHRDGPPGAPADESGGPSVFQGRRTPNVHHNGRGDQHNNRGDFLQGTHGANDAQEVVPPVPQSSPPYGAGPGYGFSTPPQQSGSNMPRSFSGNFASPDGAVPGLGGANVSGGMYGPPPPPMMPYGNAPPPPNAPPPANPLQQVPSSTNNTLGINLAAPSGATPLSQSFLNVTFSASGNHFPSNDRTNPGTPLNFSFGAENDSGLAHSESSSYAAGGAIPSTLSPTAFQPNTPVRRASNLSSSGTYRHNPYAPVTPVTSNPGSGRVSPLAPASPHQGPPVSQVNPNVPVSQHFANNSHVAASPTLSTGWSNTAAPTFATGGGHFSSAGAQAYRTATTSQMGANIPPPPTPPE